MDTGFQQQRTRSARQTECGVKFPSHLRLGISQGHKLHRSQVMRFGLEVERLGAIRQFDCLITEDERLCGLSLRQQLALLEQQARDGGKYLGGAGDPKPPFRSDRHARGDVGPAEAFAPNQVIAYADSDGKSGQVLFDEGGAQDVPCVFDRRGSLGRWSDRGHRWDRLGVGVQGLVHADHEQGDG